MDGCRYCTEPYEDSSEPQGLLLDPTIILDCTEAELVHQLKDRHRSPLSRSPATDQMFPLAWLTRGVGCSATPIDALRTMLFGILQLRHADSTLVEIHHLKLPAAEELGWS